MSKKFAVIGCRPDGRLVAQKIAESGFEVIILSPEEAKATNLCTEVPLINQPPPLVSKLPKFPETRAERRKKKFKKR